LELFASHVQRPSQFGGALSPYDGLSGSHAPPLVLWIAGLVISVPANAADSPQGLELFASVAHLASLAVFILVDLLTGWMIFQLTTEAYARPSAFVPRVLAESIARSTRRLPVLAAATFMLNPFSVVSCTILNLNVLGQLVLATMLLAAVRGRAVATMILLAVSVYSDMYPLLIVAPILLLLHRSRFGGRVSEYPQYRADQFIDHAACRFVGEDAEADTEDDRNARRQVQAAGFQSKRILKVVYQPIALPAETDDETQEVGKDLTPEAAKVHAALASMDTLIRGRELQSKWSVKFLALCVVCFVSTLGFLLYLSYALSGSSFSFLRSSYGYSLTLPSLSPTYSIFWYFFTSIFDRFHTFFLVIFHAHILVYLLPLMLRFWEEPLFLATLLLHLATVFKAYPTLPELMFTGTLLVLVNYPLLVPTLRRIYPMIFLNLVSLLTLTLMQYLWLQSGSGNANFFFFQNLLYLFTQLFSTMECIGAVRRLQATNMEGRIKETTRRRAQIIAETQGGASSSAESKKEQ
jgi:hypothetical protein